MLIEHLLGEQFGALHALMKAQSDPSDLPPVKTLNHLASLHSSGRPGIQFENQTHPLSALQYESQINLEKCVPTRQNNLHDLFNAGCWLNWPLSKRLINQGHLQHHHPDPSSTSERSRPRDYLTFLDEAGIILLCSDSSLPQAHCSHDWQSLFIDQRSAWGNSIVPMVLGHGLLEQCQSPYIGLTAKCLYLMVSDEDCCGSWTQLLDRADRELAARIELDLALLNEKNAPPAASMLLPLPVLGIPGWWPANKVSSFYDNENYFRPRRKTR